MRTDGNNDQLCEELRCACGNLIARLVPAGVELHCRRCKRLVILPLENGAARRP